MATLDKAINEIILTYYGGHGRSRCPTSVNKWHHGSDSGYGYLEKELVNVNVKCGTEWSDWSECDKSGCGDSFIYRTKINEKGKYMKETANCG